MSVPICVHLWKYVDFLENSYCGEELAYKMTKYCKKPWILDITEVDYIKLLKKSIICFNLAFLSFFTSVCFISMVAVERSIWL